MQHAARLSHALLRELEEIKKSDPGIAGALVDLIVSEDEDEVDESLGGIVAGYGRPDGDEADRERLVSAIVRVEPYTDKPVQERLEKLKTEVTREPPRPEGPGDRFPPEVTEAILVRVAARLEDRFRDMERLAAFHARSHTKRALDRVLDRASHRDDWKAVLQALSDELGKDEA